jgi:arylsulfatase A-like enzyme
MKSWAARWAALAGIVAACAAGCSDGADAPPAPVDERPNIVLIVVDDLGWSDFGVRSAPDLRTPHLDALAAQGVRFTSAYAVAPLCSPARAGLLTGRYPQRFGHENNTGSIGRQQDTWIGLPQSERTLADVLGGAGYVTGFIGKWHLGMRQEYHPLNRGFQEFFGFLPGHHAYHQWSEKPHNPILRGFESVQGSEYLTDAFSREAIEFVERHASDRFFLALSYSAVHEPLIVDRRRAAKLDHLPAGPRRDFAAVLSAVDDGVGALAEALRRTGIDDETLMLFTSDNGAATGLNGGLRGGKSSLYEGGLRIPLIARWPGKLPAGERYGSIVSALDLFMTAATAAGAAPLAEDGPIDGIDLLPYARGETDDAPHDQLYWRVGERHAMRDQNWKLQWQNDEPPTLHHLPSDSGEARDVAAEHPDRVQAMRAAYERWEEPMVSPRWEWIPGQPGSRD